MAFQGSSTVRIVSSWKSRQEIGARTPRVLVRFARPALLAVVAAIPLYGKAEDHIDADGPDFVDSSEVVGKGVFQFETNVQYQEQNNAGAHQQLVVTPTLFRLGVSADLEARAVIGGWQWQRSVESSSGETQSRWADSSLGAKWRFLNADSHGLLQRASFSRWKRLQGRTLSVVMGTARRCARSSPGI